MDRGRAAQYALLVMYAWDMCNVKLQNLTPLPDPRIRADGWTVVGYISASDDIAKSGSTIRSSVIGASGDPADRVCYGYIATNATQCVAVVRGTDGAEEWADDFDFLMQDHPAANAGLVDQGFFSIFSTMKFVSALGVESDIVAGIAAAAAGKDLMVLGHSLGAALATYLVLQLNLQGLPASACMFASPKTGNSTWVQFFEGKVGNYDVFNYECDVVPKVPPADVLHFSAYQQLLQAKTIPSANADADISDNPLCNHHLICYTALLDPATYKKAIGSPDVSSDDRNCATCVLGVDP
jgi:triacylglycerol lipase